MPKTQIVRVYAGDVDIITKYSYNESSFLNNFFNPKWEAAMFIMDIAVAIIIGLLGTLLPNVEFSWIYLAACIAAGLLPDWDMGLYLWRGGKLDKYATSIATSRTTRSWWCQ